MRKYNVGLQLYSVRDDMAKDFEGTLKKVKEIGYDYVEFAGFYGKSPEEIKGILAKYDLKCVSVHQGMDPYLNEGNAIIDYMADLGVKYVAIPWYEREKLEYGTSVWDETISNFKKYGEALKKAGMEMIYHNHDFEFDKIDGMTIFDRLYSTLEGTLNPQIDTCWVCYAGFDPAEYIRKYADRLSVLHLKDFNCKELAGGPAYALIDADGNAGDKPSKADNEFKFRPLGMGRQDFDAIIEATEETNIHTLIVEQDESPDMPALEAVKISREYLKEKYGI